MIIKNIFVLYRIVQAELVKMLKKALKIVVFMATSVIALPYSVAFLANMLYGWPQIEDKYRRAFHPRKVYSLTYSILQQTMYLKYAKLFYKYKKFYKNPPQNRLLKVSAETRNSLV